jgi:hypothetical protein
MRRRVGTVIVAKLAVVAFVDNPVLIGWRELRKGALILVDAVEQRGKRGAQVEAATTPVANFINTQCFFFEVRGIDWMYQRDGFHVPPGRKQSAVSHQHQGGINSSSSLAES